MLSLVTGFMDNTMRKNGKMNRRTGTKKSCFTHNAKATILQTLLDRRAIFGKTRSKIKVKMKSEKAAAAKKGEREETRSKAVREFLLSFQLSIIQPVPEIPRNQCVSFYMCVCLNGAIGPRLDNGPRPFAVTPPHHRDREREEEIREREGKEKKEGEEEER